MTARRITVVLATALVACTLPLAASASSSQAQASPKEWTTVMCTSLVQWQKTVVKSAASLQSTLGKLQGAGNLNLRSVRSQLVSFLDDLAQSTDDVRAKLHKVGAPSISHGGDIEKQLEKGFQKLAANFRGIADRTRKLPLTSPTAFLRQAGSVESAISGATNGLGDALSALQKYDSSKIEAAAKSIPACKALG